jgi:glycosyltransferase involved in cell wall biosynthesis
MRPVRVLLVAPSFDIVGGQSVQAERLMQALGSESNVEIAFQPTNPRFPPGLRWLDRVRYAKTIFREILYTAQLYRRANNIHVLHVFTAGFFSYWLTYVPAALCQKIFGTALILHYHDGRAERHFKRSHTAMRWASRADCIVVPSRFLTEVFGSFALHAIAIPNVADVRRFRYRRREHIRPKFLHNRGLESHYNVACSIRAFARVQQRYPESSLVIAHDGPLRQALESMVKKMGLQHVVFSGAVAQERMPELYDDADIYLMSPDIDNMPLSILECFASGLPVVSTAVGGVPEMITDERTGLLAAPNDDRALAEAALRLIEEPGLALRLTGNAREECDRYGPARVAADWGRLYRELTLEGENDTK